MVTQPSTEKGNFVETCYPLLNGELPSRKELEEFETAITRHTMLHEQMNRFFHGFRRDAHPMAIMVGVVARRHFIMTARILRTPNSAQLQADVWLRKIPTLLPWHINIGQPLVYPRNDLDYASNFLQYVLRAM